MIVENSRRLCGDDRKTIKCLEFFAGIGGFHYALREAGLEVHVRALDINDVTNKIYKYNFPETDIYQCNIGKLTVDYYDDYNAELWLLSPPCQPFTKKGLRKDVEDRRCDALKSICSALINMKHPPRYIILENVCGFETSKAHDLFRDTLVAACYYIEEYVVSPSEIGIPNSRPRYYLLAKLSHNFKGPSESKIIDVWPLNSVPRFQQRVIGDYLWNEADEDNTLVIPSETVQRYANVMHFVTLFSRHSTCFTKSYFRYVAGTGPILLSLRDDEAHDMTTCEQLRSFVLEDNCKNLANCQVRYFSWREMANLLGFPRSFMKPPDISTRQMYHALGNSISVSGVAILIQHLFKL